MFIDASALTALLTDEDEARELLARLQRTGTRLTSPLAVWEAAVAVARVLKLSVSAAAEAGDSILGRGERPRELDPRQRIWDEVAVLQGLDNLNRKRRNGS